MNVSSSSIRSPNRRIGVGEDPAVVTGRRRGPSQQQIVGLASLLCVLVVWEFFGRVNPTFLSYPTAVATAAWNLLVVDRRLLAAFGETLWGLSVGYVIALTLAIALGYLMAAVRTVDLALLPYVNALYATPRIALIPLLVLWVGIQFELRVTIVILSSIFPMILTVRDGARTVADEYTDVARSFVAGAWQTWRTTTLPGSLPFVFAALRIGLQRALIGVIVAEMAASVAGTGRIILQYGQFFQTANLLVPIIVIGLFSIFLTGVLRRIQDVATPWRRSRPTSGRGVTP
jgi:ABC-type nitrate/sulfonate/bicarbonate transport system permease component